MSDVKNIKPNELTGKMDDSDLLKVFQEAAAAQLEEAEKTEPVIEEGVKPSGTPEEVEESQPPIEGQADALAELLPEKFRTGKDVKEAIGELVKSYERIESENTRTRAELDNAVEMLRGLSLRDTPQRTESQSAEAEIEEIAEDLGIEIDPTELWDNPTATINKVAKAIQSKLKSKTPAVDPNAIAQNVEARLASKMAINAVRNPNPAEFDAHAQYLAAVLEQNKHLDNPMGLPIAYEKAKEMRTAHLSQVRSELGVSDEAVKNYKQDILNELLSKLGENKELQKAVAGISGGSGGVEKKVAQAEEKPQQPSEVLSNMILKADQRHPLLTEDF